MTTETWLDEEPGFGAALDRAGVVLRRGFEHRGLALALGLLLAIGVVTTLHFTRPAYAPRYVLRVLELNQAPTVMPRPKRALREYVREGVFTNLALSRLIVSHGLYPGLWRSNREAALDSFREDIEVEVYQNYFVEERDPESAPRSAHIAVGYRSPDRQLALQVTRELGELIAQREREVRARISERAASDAQLAVVRATRELSERRSQALEKQLEIRRAATPDPMAEVELVSLLGSLGAKQRQLDEAQTKNIALELGAALEQGGVGLSFEVVDDGSAPSSTGPSRTKLAAIFLASFVVGTPFVTALLGAFQSERGAA